MGLVGYILIGIAVGASAEVAARVRKWWLYHDPQQPVFNVLIVFGLVMGTLASCIPRIGVAGAYLIGVAIGLLYEIANLRLLKWWYFPGERLMFLRGHAAIVLAIAAVWGAVPVLIAELRAALF